jgi:hypothetical protein
MMSLRLLVREFLGSLDVLVLCALVPAAQQNDQLFSTLHKIDSIPGTGVHAQFADTLSNWRDIAGIAECEAVNSACDLCLGASILQRREPVGEFVGAADLDRV